MAFQALRRIAKGESDIDFIGRSKVWLAVSAVVLGVSLVGVLVVRLDLGLEFEGGTALEVPLQRDASVEDIRDALGPAGLATASVQVSSDRVTGRRQALVRTETTDPQTIDGAKRALAEVAGAPTPDDVSLTSVGPTWGRQISTKMLRALIVFLVLVVAYISFRFEPKMAVGALAAMFHDLLATAGIYALIGFEVSPATVIALLTLLGYSLYDTVVVFDRVGENAETLTARTGTTYSDMVNRSVNQVLMRSINTSLTGLLPVGGLLFVGAFLLGAQTLKDLALALFVGTAVSTYSSIFVAAPLLAWLKEREPRYRQLRARTTGRPAVAVGVAAGADAEAPERAPLRVHRGAPRPRRRKRGRRRR